MFDFIRTDLVQLNAYTPHPGGIPTIRVDHLDTNESPYDLPLQLKEKLAWTYQQEIATNRYPDGSHYHLKNAIAQYVTESANLQENITGEQISVGNGSDELIRSLLIATCLGGEGAIFTANPTFSMYEILAQTLGIPVIIGKRSQIDFSLDLEFAQQAITQTQNPAIRVIFVVHPNSPTANALNEQEINWLRNLDSKILVVIDEAYFEFNQTSLVGELARHPNWVILRTFSKAFRLASHRVGYAIANPELIQILEKVRLPYNLPGFSQLAALVAIENRSLILPIIQTIIQERDKLYENLTQISSLKIWSSDANFIYARLQNTNIDHDQKLAEITAKLKEKGTLIRHTGGGLRITVGTPQENQRTFDRFQEILR